LNFKRGDLPKTLMLGCPQKLAKHDDDDGFGIKFAQKGRSKLR
jgi:hypothetical protein